MEPLTVFTFSLSALIIVWGYLVGVKRKHSLIPRFHTTGKIKDERLYGQWIGYNLMVLGTLGGIDAILQTMFPQTHLTMFLAYMIVIVPTMGLRTIIGKRRFESVR
ncbi:MAG: hypothetical protein LUQ17_05055 [Methanomicrobiales archaeon]|nr:hypothetical protein [Methanomicrobiales archaeon]